VERFIKLLTYVTCCCGIVLLLLALVAMPPGMVRADDPPPLGDPTVGVGGIVAIDPADFACYITYSPPCYTTIDPCYPSRVCTAPVGALYCHCK